MATIKYVVVGDLIQEIVNDVITNVWERGKISEGVKIQLMSKGGKPVVDFFAKDSKKSKESEEPEKPE